jgi:hypothetical protein
MQLKISNNQLYSNLVSNITRYDVPKYDDDGNIVYNGEGKVIYVGNDDTEYNLFISEEYSHYDNYDKFLLDYFNDVVKNNEIYDLLKFRYV